MKIWRVYAQNCRAIEPIKEIDKAEAEKDFMALVNEGMQQDIILIETDEDGDITDEKYQEAWEAAVEKVENYFYKEGFLSVGDYMLVLNDQKPTARPSMGGWDLIVLE
jgi:hypothetical protein